MTLRVSPLEAIALVTEHCTARGLNYPTDDLEAWLVLGECWEVAPRADPYDLDSLRIGAAIFLVTPNGAVHRGSGSLPPRARWHEVPATDIFPARQPQPGRPVCTKAKYDTITRASALLNVPESDVRERPLSAVNADGTASVDGELRGLDATYYWSEGRGALAVILARYNPTYLLAGSAINPEDHIQDFADGRRTY